MDKIEKMNIITRKQDLNLRRQGPASDKAEAGRR